MSTWGRSLLEEPIRWSRWRRLVAWYRHETLPRTLMEAQRRHTEAMSQMVEYGRRQYVQTFPRIRKDSAETLDRTE